MKHDSLCIRYTDGKQNHKLQYDISIFKKPTNDKEYTKLEKILDELIDEVRDDYKHPLATVMQIIGENLEQYDNEYYQPIGHNISDIDMVKYIMTANNLHQKDLADIFGSQANVSKYLNGERSLSKKQIIGLKTRFGISADFFIKVEPEISTPKKRVQVKSSRH